MAVYRGGGEVLVTATSAYQMKFSQWRPLSRVVVIKSRERRKFYAKIVGKWNGQGSRRGGDRAELGQHPVFLRQCHSPPSLSTRMRLRPRRVRVSAIQRGEWKSCFAHSSSRYRWIKLSLLPWPRLFFSFSLPENWTVGRWKHGSRNFSKSGTFGIYGRKILLRILCR